MEHDLITGTGLQVIDVDLTGSDAQLLASAARITATVVQAQGRKLHDNVEAAWSLGTVAPTTNNAQVYQISETVFGETEVKTYFRFPVTFKERGTYFVQIKIEDGAGEYSSSPTGFIIGVGDGLPNGYRSNG